MSHGYGSMQQLLLTTVRQIVAEQVDAPPSDTMYLLHPEASLIYPARLVVPTALLWQRTLAARREAGADVSAYSHLSSATRALRHLVKAGALLRVWPSTQHTSLRCPCCGRRGEHPRGRHAFKETLAVMLPPRA